MQVFNVRCDKTLADALAARVAEEKAAESAWWKACRADMAARVAAEKLGARDRALLLAGLEQQFAAMRDAGEVRGTRSAFVLPALRELLAARGWDRRWKPVPDTRPRRGRPWGTHDAHFAARVTLYLPDPDATTLTRACYWVSAPAVAALQEWYDTHGDHWRGQLHNPDARWTGAGPSPTDLDAREQLVGGIHTTGQVLRDAITHALAV